MSEEVEVKAKKSAPKKVQKVKVIGCNGNSYRITGQNLRVTSAKPIEVEYDDQVKQACKAKLIRIF